MQVVAVIACFADSLTAGGTCTEEAAALVQELADEAAFRAEQRQKRAAERHAAKEQRAAARVSGALAAAEDMEDSDAESDDDEAAERAMLNCQSLSKLVTDYIDENQGEGGMTGTLADALAGLTSRRPDGAFWANDLQQVRACCLLPSAAHDLQLEHACCVLPSAAHDLQ